MDNNQNNDLDYVKLTMYIRADQLNKIIDILEQNNVKVSIPSDLKQIADFFRDGDPDGGLN